VQGSDSSTEIISAYSPNAEKHEEYAKRITHTSKFYDNLYGKVDKIFLWLIKQIQIQIEGFLPSSQNIVLSAQSPHTHICTLLEYSANTRIYLNLAIFLLILGLDEYYSRTLVFIIEELK